jgi:hypothetical protein
MSVERPLRERHSTECGADMTASTAGTSTDPNSRPDDSHGPEAGS